MDNEHIKEILNNLKYIDKTSILKNNDAKIILDYITNLQQENQDIKDTLQDKLDYIGHLKELCDKYEEEHNTEFKIWKDERCQLLDYKSRNKKAIEYINNWLFEAGGNGACMDYEDIVEMKNILNNGDDKNNNE